MFIGAEDINSIKHKKYEKNDKTLIVIQPDVHGWAAIFQTYVRGIYSYLCKSWLCNLLSHNDNRPLGLAQGNMWLNRLPY